MRGSGGDHDAVAGLHVGFLLAEARSRKASLPPLEQITLGGEASPGDLLEEIQTAFPGAKVSQVYASTEFGSITSVRDGKPGLEAVKKSLGL